MEITVKSFEELSINELHDLLKLRSKSSLSSKIVFIWILTEKDQRRFMLWVPLAMLLWLHALLSSWGVF